MASQEEINLIITAEVAKASAALKQIQKEMKGLGDETEKGKSKLQAFKDNWKGAATAIVAGGLAFKKVIDVARQFEQSVANVAAVSGDTTEALGELAKKAGVATVFSASEAADAMLFLAQSGQKAAEMDKTLIPTLDLAASSGLGLAQATGIVADTLAGFQLGSEDAADAVDLMAKTTSIANTDMRQLGEAMKKAAPAAASFGVSIEETSTILATMTKFGLKAEEAGTSFRNMLSRLNSPSTEAAKSLARVGLSVDEIRTLLPTPIKLFEKMRNSGLNMADMSKILGVEMTSMNAMILRGGQDFKKFGKQLENATGAAGEMAATRMDTFEGSIKTLGSAIEKLILDIMTGSPSLLDGFKFLIQGVTALVRAVLAAPGPIKVMAGTMVGLSVAFMVVKKAAEAFGKSIETSFKTVSTVIAIVSALVATVLWFGKNWDEIALNIGLRWEQVKNFFAIAWGVIKVGVMEAAAFMLRNVPKIFGPLIKGIDLVIEAYNALTDSNVRTFSAVLKGASDGLEASAEAERKRLAKLREGSAEEKRIKMELAQLHGDTEEQKVVTSEESGQRQVEAVKKSEAAKRREYKKTTDEVGMSFEELQTGFKELSQQMTDQQIEEFKRATQALVEGTLQFAGQIQSELAGIHAEDKRNREFLLDQEMEEKRARATEELDILKKRREEEQLALLERQADERADVENAILTDAEKKQRLKKLEKKHDKQLQNLDKKDKKTLELQEARTKEELDKIDKEADRKKRKLAREFAIKEKRLALAAAFINVGEAVTKTLASVPYPFSLPLVAAVGALGAAKIKTISDRPIPKMATGGIIPGSPGGRQIIAGENRRAEAIVPLETARGKRALQSALGGMGGGGSAPTVNVHIDKMMGDKRSVDNMLDMIDEGLEKRMRRKNSAFGDRIKATTGRI